MRNLKNSVKIVDKIDILMESTKQKVTCPNLESFREFFRDVS